MRAPGYAERVRGCLLGGALGDALGAPVEFMSLARIRATFGPAGLQEPAPAYGRLGAVTDDTQMTLFTAEGVIRAHAQAALGACHPTSVIHQALLRWLYTQGDHNPEVGDPDGWLVDQRELFAHRAPGTTCLSALRQSQRLGDEAGNDSKGCGAIMRIAPIGLLGAESAAASLWAGPARLLEVAAASARTTHGHPDSTFAAAYFALAVAQLAQGASLREALEQARRPLARELLATRVLQSVEWAQSLALSKAPSTPEVVARLGEAWVAEEALAIAIFCGLRAGDFEEGVRLAVNHGGDSDSTGSLTGQLLGTLWGMDALPDRWLDGLELRAVIEAVADDLVATAHGRPLPSDRLYPVQ